MLVFVPLLPLESFCQACLFYAVKTALNSNRDAMPAALSTHGMRTNKAKALLLRMSPEIKTRLDLGKIPARLLFFLCLER